MGWLYLIGAILFEVFATSMMKMSNGLSQLLLAILMFAGYAASFTLLAFAQKTVEVSVAYAVWSALGIVLITLIGIFYFGKSFSYQKAISLILIIAGVVSLKLCTN